MSEKIYGVDPGKPVTPLIVRDAIIECFSQAHCADAGMDISKEEGRIYCKTIVQKAFEDTGGDFNKPTKESIRAALKNLAEFARKFRDQETVQKHYGQIMELVEKLK
jgi:hypothetical protein